MAIGWPPDIVQRLFNVAITGEPIQYERYNETLDRYYDTRVFAPHYGQFAHIFSDITERKRTEITNERFRISQKAILDNLPMMAWLKDTESRLEMVNEPYAKACGHTVLECIGKTDLDLFPAEMAQGYMADDFEVCTSGRQKQVEELISTPIGEKWHLTYKTPIFDELGHIIGTAGIAQDITERKQAEVELRNSKENYRAIVDAFDGMLYICSQDYQILYLNNKMIERIGHNAVGEKCFNALHGLDDVCPWCVNERILQGEAVRWEVQSPKDSRWYYVVNTPIFNNDGTISKQAMIQDITERKQAELERERLENQLFQAQKMESVGRLAGGVAHDFNNLLTIINGYAQLGLMDSEPGSPNQEYLLAIQNAVDKSTNLTRQLLTFARKQSVSPKVIDLNEAVVGMLKMLQRLIGENIHLSWQAEAGLWHIKVDPTQIDQILANLCVNARDAIADVGKITIETANITIEDGGRAHEGYEPGDYVKLTVSDNGCGIDEETQSHIFEPFFTTKGVGEGTGLGLATVYGIVKQNNGTIDLQSKPGSGTTFAIYLPRYVGNDPATFPEESVKVAPYGHETVLLVEDELEILNLTTLFLSRQGYTVLQANSPSEALSLAREHANEIHLLITDVILPEINGKDLANRLLAEYSHFKCLFMSGYTADTISQYGLSHDNINFIHKPFTLPCLAFKVREVLDGH